MGPTELKEYLERLGVEPNRKLGQCFLVDDNVSRWIVDQLTIEAGDTVVEVGPGAGALTTFLAERARKLVLIEFDRKLAEGLKKRFADDESVEVIHEDAVKFDVRKLFPHRPVKFIGNLPYSSGTEILRTFLSSPSPVAEALVMLQQEVADRICAVPGSKDFGALTLHLQARWTPTRIKTLGPESFYPRPQIESTIIRLTPRDRGEFPPFDERLFRSLVKRGFAQRRKQLRKNLGIEREEWAKQCEALDCADTVRAEELTLAQWITLTNLQDTHPLKSHAQSGDEMFDVVDERNEVTGQEARAKVHAEDLWHRAVHVFVFNPRGDLLLQKRSHLKDSHPGKWDSSASGHLDVGEPYAEAAVRELEEELGIVLPEGEGEAPEFVAEIRPCEATGWEFVQLFVCRYQGAVKSPAAEVETVGWFAPELVEQWVENCPGDFATGFLECWKAFRGRLGGSI